MMVSAGRGRGSFLWSLDEGFHRSTEEEERGEGKCRCGQLAGGGGGFEELPAARRPEGS